MATTDGGVFYQQIYAECPETGLIKLEADVHWAEVINCKVPPGKDPYTFANQMLENEDPRVGHGNVACIDITKSSYNKKESNDNLYLYFGWETWG